MNHKVMVKALDVIKDSVVNTDFPLTNKLADAIYAIEAELAKPEQVSGETSDGYHTFNELYEFRKAYNAALFNEWAANDKYSVHKSKRHYDGHKCFGGGWFIVVAQLPKGQISNHYEMKDWDKFQIPETDKAMFEYDNHTSEDVLQRLFSLRPLAEPEQEYDHASDLRTAVFTVLDGWTLPFDARKMLETAYYAQTEQDINILHIGTDVIEEGMHLIVRRGNEIIHSQFYEAPKRQWVGLTDEELSEIYNVTDEELSEIYDDFCTQHPEGDVNIADFILIARALESKLKEKNT